jgi:hypothetical protein
VAHPLVENPHGADPGAEEAAEEKCSHEDQEREGQPLVDGPARQKGEERHERVELEKKGDFISLHIAEIGHPDEQHEECKEEDRVDAPDVLQRQQLLSHGMGSSLLGRLAGGKLRGVQ